MALESEEFGKLAEAHIHRAELEVKPPLKSRTQEDLEQLSEAELKELIRSLEAE